LDCIGQDTVVDYGSSEVGRGYVEVAPYEKGEIEGAPLGGWNEVDEGRYGGSDEGLHGRKVVVFDFEDIVVWCNLGNTNYLLE